MIRVYKRGEEVPICENPDCPVKLVMSEVVITDPLGGRAIVIVHGNPQQDPPVTDEDRAGEERVALAIESVGNEGVVLLSHLLQVCEVLVFPVVEEVGVFQVTLERPELEVESRADDMSAS